MHLAVQSRGGERRRGATCWVVVTRASLERIWRDGDVDGDGLVSLSWRCERGRKTPCHGPVAASVTTGCNVWDASGCRNRTAGCITGQCPQSQPRAFRAHNHPRRSAAQRGVAGRAAGGARDRVVRGGVVGGGGGGGATRRTQLMNVPVQAHFSPRSLTTHSSCHGYQ
jgi:hypothetical protein